jgi:3-methyladenine DNA glycosylase Mpg
MSPPAIMTGQTERNNGVFVSRSDIYVYVRFGIGLCLSAGPSPGNGDHGCNH